MEKHMDCTQINELLASNRTGCTVEEASDGLQLFHGSTMVFRGIPANTDPLTILSAAKNSSEVALSTQGAGDGGRPGLGRQFVEASVWGGGVTVGSIVAGTALNVAADLFLGGSSDS
jgi:hypothetical protein